MSDVRENLKAYIDGQLSANEARQVQDALSRDAALRKEFDEMRRISSTLREGAVNPPVAGLDRTLSVLAARKTPVKPPLFRFLPALAIGVTCLAALVIIGRLQQPQAAYNDENPMPVAKMASRVSRTPAAQGFTKTESQYSAAASGMDLGRADVNLGAGRAGVIPADAGESVRAVTAPPKGPVTVADSPQVIKTGHLEIAVSDAKDAIARATTLAKSLGGFVESSDVSGAQQADVTGTMTLRIPVNMFDSALSQLRGFGKVTDESTNGRDVTAQIVDTEARLKVMRTEEQAYVEILAKAKHVDDVLSVRERLDEVRQEIESMAAQSKLLKGQAAMSTLDVVFTQKAPAKTAGTTTPQSNDWLKATWAVAWGGLADAGRALTQGLIYLVVFCPIWIPIVLLAGYLGRRSGLFA